MVELVSPGPRLEMFARGARQRWEVWGDEVESDVEIAADNPPGSNETHREEQT